MRSSHFERAIERSEKLFAEIAAASADVKGVTRAAYSTTESGILDLLKQVGAELGLECSNDLAGNLYLTLAGEDRTLPRILVGSHVDSVPQGGNFDGLAGVLGGIACLETLRLEGCTLRRDVSVMAIRGEENAWFGAQHIGSRSALGLLDGRLLEDAKRSDSGLSLGEHMRSIGLNTTALLDERAYLSPRNVKCYLELHIEQGPVLVEQGHPVGIVTAIRGNARCAQATCIGEAGHAGVVPLRLRHDAVVAVAQLVSAMHDEWQQRDMAGDDLVLTFGKFSTDPASHAVTTVAGRVDFSFEARSHTAEVLDAIRGNLASQIDAIERRHGVNFEFGPWTQGRPAAMDSQLVARLREACAAHGIERYELASGAGHDAQDFVAAGIPAAMIFVRNDHGSHNADEAMAMDDYAVAVRLLLTVLEGEAQ